MTDRRKTYLTPLLVAAGINCAQADTMPGIYSMGGAMILPEGKLMATYGYIGFTRENMYDGTQERPNMQHLDARANVNILALRYGMHKDFDFRILLPYKSIEATAQLGPNNVAIDNNGIGDMVVMGRYVLKHMAEDDYQLSLGFGIKLPTGSTDKGFKVAPPFAQNTNTPLPTQMGTGREEYKAELGFSKDFGSMRLDALTMYTYRPLAEHEYDFGNEIAYDISFMAEVTDQINVGLEYNGKYNTSTNMGDDTNPVLREKLPFKAFSGSVGYITPEIQYLPFGKPKIHLSVGVSFLAHYNVKEYQPLEKRRVLVRFGYLF